MIGGLSALEVFGAFGTAATIFGGGIQLGRKLANSLAGKKLERTEAALQAEKQRTESLQATLAGLNSLLNDQTDVWLRSPPDLAKHLSQIRSSIPIITVCNFKGGVGKTTLTSLLAAYFDLHKKKRVLLIDFDYQGSLTDTLLASADLKQLEASSRRLLDVSNVPEDTLAHAYPLHPALSQTELFSCFYGFNRIENRVMMQWIAEAREARYLTHAILSDPATQKAFDIVIIDAPPRLSTATVNALCASTHVLIPTILDSMSTQAALNTLDVVRQFRKLLNPGLEVLGIVPTMVNRAELNGREKDSLERMIARLPEFWKQAPLPHIFVDQMILRREAIATALGTTLAFDASKEVRTMAVAIGDSLEERLFAHAIEAPDDHPSTSGNVTSIASAKRRA